MHLAKYVTAVVKLYVKVLENYTERMHKETNKEKVLIFKR